MRIILAEQDDSHDNTGNHESERGKVEMSKYKVGHVDCYSLILTCTALGSTRDLGRFQKEGGPISKKSCFFPGKPADWLGIKINAGK